VLQAFARRGGTPVGLRKLEVGVLDMPDDVIGQKKVATGAKCVSNRLRRNAERSQV